MSEDFQNIPALSQDEEKETDSLRKVHIKKYRLIRSGNVKYLDMYVKDSDPFIRKAVAQFGGLKYVFQLMHDPDDSVRIMAAKNSNRNIATIMTKDPNNTVRKYAGQVLRST